MGRDEMHDQWSHAVSDFYAVYFVVMQGVVLEHQ